MTWNAAQAAALCGLVIIAAITAIYLMVVATQDRGRHAAAAADADADMFLHALHHEPVWTATVTLPASGPLPMLPPDPPPDETCPQPVVYTAWGGKTVEQLVDEIFAQACAEVTS